MTVGSVSERGGRGKGFPGVCARAASRGGWPRSGGGPRRLRRGGEDPRGQQLADPPPGAGSARRSRLRCSGRSWGSGGAGPRATQLGRAGCSCNPVERRRAGRDKVRLPRGVGTSAASQRGGLCEGPPGDPSVPLPLSRARTRPCGSLGQRGDRMAPLRWGARGWPGAVPGGRQHRPSRCVPSIGIERRDLP